MVGKKKPSAKGAASKKVIVRRVGNKIFGVFIDGTGLDRASRRIQRKVDMTALVKSLTTGGEAEVARYYTLLPQEDDSRHRAFLEAVSKAGLEIFLKRLPPKGIERQVAIDVEMAADIVAFALGSDNISNLSLVSASGQFSIMPQTNSLANNMAAKAAPANISPRPALDLEEVANLTPEKLDQEAAGIIDSSAQAANDNPQLNNPDLQRVIVVVCPSREMAYPLALCKHFGADTISADFGKFTSGDLLKSAAKWIDLSDSQTIWKA